MFSAGFEPSFSAIERPQTDALGWVHTCNVTAYRNTVSWQCGRDTCPRNILKVGYVVTLRACSVCCRYLAVALKGWYGYGRSRRGRAQLVSRSICSCSQAVSKSVWHIPLLCVQWKTPDDGQRNCPKHVEFHSKNKFEKLVHLVVFIIRNESIIYITNFFFFKQILRLLSILHLFTTCFTCSILDLTL
jgi:hypothetical protein